MRELIRDVAEVISNLVTLGLLNKINIVTQTSLNPQTKKYQMEVSFYVTNQEILDLCLKLFQELGEENGHSMKILKNDYCPLTVEFYEQ